MTSLRVKPAADGAIIPNPDRMFQPLAAAGEDVPDSAFWRRRLAAGDVVEAPPVAAAEPESEPVPVTPKAGK